MLVVLGSSKCIKSKNALEGVRHVKSIFVTHHTGLGSNCSRSIHSPYSRPADRFDGRSCLLP